MAQAAHAHGIGTGSGGMRSFLPHSIAATLGVLAFPSAVLFSLLFLAEPNPPVLLCSAISIALSSAASVIGARLWQRHPSSNEISFGDLMIWSWWTRRRAEARLNRGTKALGLDRRGTPIDDQKLTRADQLRILHELNNALESKDPYTRGHSGRVERHVFRMANTMGLSVHEIEDLRLAASLHDVGKIRVPDHILRKPGKLTPNEYRIMQDHPSVGAWMLSYVGNQDVIEAVRYHHERWDGRGYPDGVTGTDIPLFARMIAVADTFDAITSTRPYRAKAAREEGLKELEKAAGSQLDPMCVEAFASSLPESLPIAALLYLLPFGIKKLIREFGVVARRTGMQTIATGVSAASAAVLVTTPVVAPSLGAPPRAERAVETGSESGAPDVLADDGDAGGTEVADDESGVVEGSSSVSKKDDEETDLTPGTLTRSDEPLTSIPLAANDVPPSDSTGDSGTDTGTDTATTTDGGGSGAPATFDNSDSGSGNSGGDESSGNDDGNDDKADKDKDENSGRSNGNSTNGNSDTGNPGASAGQEGSDSGNSGQGKDKDKDKDKGKPADEPGNSDNGGSGDGGVPDAGDGGGDSGGNSGDGGSDHGNPDHGNGGGNGNGNSGDHGGGNGNSSDHGGGNANSNSGGEDKEKKEKDPTGTE